MTVNNSSTDDKYNKGLRLLLLSLPHYHIQQNYSLTNLFQFTCTAHYYKRAIIPVLRTKRIGAYGASIVMPSALWPWPWPRSPNLCNFMNIAIYSMATCILEYASKLWPWNQCAKTAVNLTSVCVFGRHQTIDSKLLSTGVTLPYEVVTLHFGRLDAKQTVFTEW